MTANKTTQAFIDAVQSQIGTPFVLQGRSGFNVLDCVGAISVPAAMVGVVLEPVAPYTLNCDYSERLIEYLARNMDAVPLDEIRAGDVLAFWLSKPRKPRHLGTVVPGTGAGSALDFVHTSEAAGRVVQNTLNPQWQSHIHTAWRLRGIN